MCLGEAASGGQVEAELWNPFAGMASVTEVFGFSLFAHGIASGFQQELQRRSGINSTNNQALVPHWLAYTTVAEEDAQEFQQATNMAAAAPPSPSEEVQRHPPRTTPPQQQGQEQQQKRESPPAAANCPTSRVSKLDVIYRGPGASIAHDQEASVQVSSFTLPAL